MEQDQVNDLINKYIAGKASDTERKQLNDWYRSTAYKDAEYPDMEALVEQRMLARLEQEIRPLRKMVFPLRRLAVAASVLLCLGLAVYFYKARYTRADRESTGISNDIEPGGNRAVLTLSGGEKVNLSAAKSGIVIDLANLHYNDGTKVASNLAAQQEMMLSTPEGGTYQVILPDSTRVWLNAASSLKFPATFGGLEHRKVELDGEAYFEVAKLVRRSNAGRETRVPFFVVSEGQEVEVLGTHFNINAYADQAGTKTSLLEGLIRIKNNNGNALLKPGQQAISKASGIELLSGDAEDAIAWKNGYFMFDNEDLASVMQKLCRWYGVTVNYEDEAVKNVKYYGTISRFEKISKVLTKLETTGNLKFDVKGRSVNVALK